ncbi:hypothetical protein MAR621_03110 [Maribacter dokdonensis]|uniref:hypothetical protein n=1 Tax=Maribacter dokdonensis TaxID=320912 RepID=UPI001B054448|nr:hypothetical protein [Maribacter dokdonensis]CAG2532916.1 hypothetical protein MAR621_03110 [Maribacter dokdonensis]
MAELIKKTLTLNQKWYLTLCLGVVLNIGYNVWDFFHDMNVAKANEVKFATLTEESRKKDEQIAYLIAENIKNARNTEKMPVAIWKKKRLGESFVYEYYNLTFWKQFLRPLGVSRYYLYNKTDFAVFGYDDATAWYLEDVKQLELGMPSHIDRDFRNTDSTLVKSGYTKWSEEEDGHEYTWGIMDDFFIDTLEVKK